MNRKDVSQCITGLFMAWMLFHYGYDIGGLIVLAVIGVAVLAT